MANKSKGNKYKLKTYKGAAKRFRMTGTGKIVRTKGGKSHLRRRKSTRSKQKFDKMLVVTAIGDRRRLMRMAPYMRLYKANPPK